MIKINYESDFKLTEKTEERFVDVPFTFTYTTNSGIYTASYKGDVYTRCKRNEDGSITVIFNDHGLGVGKLKVRREFFIPDTDFPDGVYNIVSNDTTDIILVEGKTDNTDVEEEFHPPYNTIIDVEVVDNLDSDASDKALSARQGGVLKGMIPTKVSGLENDEGYITEIPDNIATKEDVNEAVSGKQDALTLTVKDNGNIVIGNISGQSKEFMPATPSGDPMHYAYENAYAVYNATDQIIQRTAPWNTEETWVKNEDGTYTYSEVPATVQHLPNHWYLNGLGNLTNKDMCAIYEAGRLQVGVHMSNWRNSKAKTTLDGRKNGGEGAGYNFYYFSGADILEVVYICSVSQVWVSNLHNAFNAKNVKIIMPTIVFTATESSAAYNAFLGATNLRRVFISGLKVSLSFKDSRNIARRCILYMINNAAPTSAITITLHADAYARLAEDADIVAALEAKPLVTLVSA
jgi:frataxin-like iron-binding protein CyaY